VVRGRGTERQTSEGRAGRGEKEKEQEEERAFKSAPRGYDVPAGCLWA